MTVTPILRMFDEVAARDFYLGFLGFDVEWEHRFEPDLPLYMSVIVGDARLHLSQHHGDCCPGGHVRIAWQMLPRSSRRLRRNPAIFPAPA